MVRRIVVRRGGLLKPILTGHFIRDHLKEVKEDYTYHIYKAYRRRLKEIAVERKRKVEYYVPEYKHFWKYMWMFEQLGLVRRTPTFKPPKYPYSKVPVFFEIVPGMEDAKQWDSPQRYLYGIDAALVRKYKKRRGK